MLVLHSADQILGDASAAGAVDYTLHGLDNNDLAALKSGQLETGSANLLYQADSTDVAVSMTITNTSDSPVDINLYYDPAGKSARHILPVNMTLEPHYSVFTDFASLHIYDDYGQLAYNHDADTVDGKHADELSAFDRIAYTENDLLDALRNSEVHSIYIKGEITINENVKVETDTNYKLIRGEGSVDPNRSVGQLHVADGKKIRLHGTHCTTFENLTIHCYLADNNQAMFDLYNSSGVGEIIFHQCYLRPGNHTTSNYILDTNGYTFHHLMFNHCIFEHFHNDVSSDPLIQDEGNISHVTIVGCQYESCSNSVAEYLHIYRHSKLDSDSVDGVHKDTGHADGSGIDSDMVDGKHADELGAFDRIVYTASELISACEDSNVASIFVKSTNGELEITENIDIAYGTPQVKYIKGEHAFDSEHTEGQIKLSNTACFRVHGSKHTNFENLSIYNAENNSNYIAELSSGENGEVIFHNCYLAAAPTGSAASNYIFEGNGLGLNHLMFNHCLFENYETANPFLNVSGVRSLKIIGSSGEQNNSDAKEALHIYHHSKNDADTLDGVHRTDLSHYKLLKFNVAQTSYEKLNDYLPDDKSSGGQLHRHYVVVVYDEDENRGSQMNFELDMEDFSQPEQMTVTVIKDTWHIKLQLTARLLYWNYQHYPAGTGSDAGYAGYISTMDISPEGDEQYEQSTTLTLFAAGEYRPWWHINSGFGTWWLENDPEHKLIFGIPLGGGGGLASDPLPYTFYLGLESDLGSPGYLDQYTDDSALRYLWDDDNGVLSHDFSLVFPIICGSNAIKTHIRAMTTNYISIGGYGDAEAHSCETEIWIDWELDKCKATVIHVGDDGTGDNQVYSGSIPESTTSLNRLFGDLDITKIQCDKSEKSINKLPIVSLNKHHYHGSNNIKCTVINYS